MEKNSHLVGFAVHKLYISACSGNEYTWAECKKKGGGDSDFLRSDIGEHG